MIQIEVKVVLGVQGYNMDKTKITDFIINSMRFYIMLDIVIYSAEKKIKTKNNQSSLYNYVRETKEKSGLTDETINSYVDLAYRSMSSEFRSIYDIPSIVNN